MIYLKIYLIGVLVALPTIAVTDYFYLYDRQIRYMSLREVILDTLASLLSWLIVLVAIGFMLFDKKDKGYELRRKLEELNAKNQGKANEGDGKGE